LDVSLVDGKYYPTNWDDWETRRPEELGLDSAMIDEAIKYASDHETPFARDLARRIATSVAGKKCDDGEVLGPTRPRGGVNGLVLKDGYIVVEWGETRRVDMTFSVTKSYLSTCAGLALDDGLIRDVHDPVGLYMKEGHFDSPHNSKITWHHLLQQTNEWNGTLWDKHYSAGNTDDVLSSPRSLAPTTSTTTSGST